MKTKIRDEIRDGMLEYDKVSVDGSTIHNFYGVITCAILIIFFVIKDLITGDFWSI